MSMSRVSGKSLLPLAMVTVFGVVNGIYTFRPAFEHQHHDSVHVEQDRKLKIAEPESRNPNQSEPRHTEQSPG
ncbi:hypothetical protein BDY21DRAFT_335777 [Lineolata rhizophorae]|uniref:Uncharacterized protein n=1 Tax=Lineolata rhizophorae TaxID=578093 RepID=A0A6A6P9I5_9PEZI|nr:hypothetical protein BDY21DRAFT_335777 [Lineolata rhizophorae]